MLNKIKFSYREADNQDNTFTPSHTRFKCKIKYSGLQYTFDYQCNTAYTEPNIRDCVYATLCDMFTYDNCRDIADFIAEFGYNDIKAASKAYKGCKKASKALHRLFTDDELNDLMEELEEMGC